MPICDSTRPLPEVSTLSDTPPPEKLQAHHKMHAQWVCPDCSRRWETNHAAATFDALREVYCPTCQARHRLRAALVAYWPYVGMVGGDYDGGA